MNINDPEMSVDQVAAINIYDVLCVYSGTPSASGNHCRCGCRGKYYYNPLHPSVGLGKDPNRGYPILDPKEINKATVTRILGRVKEHIATGRAYTTNTPQNTKFESWVDIELDTGRSYTVYMTQK